VLGAYFYVHAVLLSAEKSVNGGPTCPVA